MSDLPEASYPSAERIDLAPGVYMPASALRIQYTRSSGPGGQNVNKVNSRAEIWVELDAIVGMTYGALARLRMAAGRRLTQNNELHMSAQAERSQERNRQAVLERLREMIVAAQVAPKPRRATKPSRAAKRRRLDAKRRRGEIKSHRKGPGSDD